MTWASRNYIHVSEIFGVNLSQNQNTCSMIFVKESQVWRPEFALGSILIIGDFFVYIFFPPRFFFSRAAISSVEKGWSLPSSFDLLCSRKADRSGDCEHQVQSRGGRLFTVPELYPRTSLLYVSETKCHCLNTCCHQLWDLLLYIMLMLCILWIIADSDSVMVVPHTFVVTEHSLLLRP